MHIYSAIQMFSRPHALCKAFALTPDLLIACRAGLLSFSSPGFVVRHKPGHTLDSHILGQDYCQSTVLLPLSMLLRHI